MSKRDVVVGLCSLESATNPEGADDDFDHGVGHPLLLLYNAKAPNCHKGNEFKGLGHYLFNIT
jgi:hypothetical protein